MTSPMATDIDFLIQKINQETLEFSAAQSFALCTVLAAIL